MHLPQVDPREVGDDLLLDVREPDEWAAGRAPGAVHLPLQQLPDRIAELPADRAVAVVCRMGGRSEQATAFLLQQGFSVRNVAGGMQSWAALGLPLEGDLHPPAVI